LDLAPVCPCGKDCQARQIDRKSTADYRKRLIDRAINLCARQTGIVGVEEDIETICWSGAREVHPISIYRLHIPSLTVGNNEIVGQIGTKRGEIGERR
jgi:hypothetical protein